MGYEKVPNCGIFVNTISTGYPQKVIKQLPVKQQSQTLLLAQMGYAASKWGG